MEDANSLDKYSVKQLKKIKESLEKNQQNKLSISNKIPKPQINILDKFTDIDDLLRISIQETRDLIMEQRETNRQMQINNKLLLALYYQEDADGKMVQKDPMGIDTTILESIARGGAMITRIVELVNKTIGTKEIIFEGEFEGILVEVLFVSSTSTVDNKDYSVRVLSDGNIVYQSTYAEFEAKGATETDMAAFEDEDNSWYLLQFQNINFMNKILVEVYESEATFSRIYLKYHRSV